MVLGNRITCRSTWTAATLLGVACLAFQASAVRAQTPDWGNLQFPSTMNAPAGSTSPQVFGQVYEPGVTDLAGPGAGIVAQLGVGPDGSDPATSLSWQWTTATYNLDVGNNDEYQATFTVPAAIGSYDYCYRYSLSGGPWVYGDFGFEGSQNGYSPADAGQLTVTAAETGINWGNTQSPPSITVDANQPTPNIYGQVWKPGVTDAPGQGSGITAQLGYGPDGTDPATEAGWQWVAASYNLDVGNNDEYFKTLTVTTPGTYDYCYRYAFNSGTWLYADLDGTDNGYSLSQAGSLTVQATTDVPARTPRTLSLQALRNPCLGRAELRLTLPYEAAVDLAVFDARGRLVQRLIAGTRPAGEEVVAWDGCDGSGTPVPHGVYLVRVLAGGEQRAVRLIRLH